MKPHTIFAEQVEAAALDQFHSALQQEYVVRAALMPDAHSGYSLPIGAVVATDGVILPAWVGYDIGCGMCAVPTSFRHNQVARQAEAIFRNLYQAIPVGFKHNRSDTPWEQEQLPRSKTLAALFAKNGHKQLGSLGSGNHFIEIGYDEQLRVWVIIHSGSRNIGHSVASHYMKLAAGGKTREGHYGFATDSQAGRDYILDQSFCLEFALANRLELLKRVIHVLQRDCVGQADWPLLINRNHNHAEEQDGLWIHRKGATHAAAGMRGVIPGNMRDGSFIVEGRGNKDALCSSSHGAGRLMGRKAAQRTLDLQQFRASMGGIVAKIDRQTLDEAPFAYKDIFQIMQQQSELVTVQHHIKPLINIKG